jgi:hypothetical protein
MQRNAKEKSKLKSKQNYVVVSLPQALGQVRMDGFHREPNLDQRSTNKLTKELFQFPPPPQS